MLLKGKPVSDRIRTEVDAGMSRLGGYVPALGIVRVGRQPAQLSYENGAVKKLNAFGLSAKVFAFEESISEEDFLENLRAVNDDPTIDGILLLMPLPRHIQAERAAALIAPEKDVDGITRTNIAKVFAGDQSGFAPCTAEAVVETMKTYGISAAGKRAVIVGRSMVVGRPLSMLLLKENATVTICHTKTADLPAECRRAEILIACAGRAHLITGDCVAPGSFVIDVGTNVVDGKLCGDVDTAEAERKAQAVTPVPGGVGGVTTAVLAKHLVQAALVRRKKEKTEGS